jgi:fucose permease
MVFFLTQFWQDIEHYSALITGIGFLPTPASVFLSSQLTSRVLVNRIPAKVLILGGLGLSASGLLLFSRLEAGTPYVQVLVSLILIGAGMGVSFVSLTTTALTGVAPADAGAASGLVNVVQQLGAALGLAVLVSVFDGVTHPGHLAGLSQTASSPERAALAHGVDITFAAAAAFAIAAVAIVAAWLRPAAGQPAQSAEVPEPAEAAVPAGAELKLEAAA